MTIYYPHFDLENKGLIRTVPDHILNIKLLALIADKILIRSSHLLNSQLSYLHIMEDQLQDFIADGRIETAIYNNHSTLDDYIDCKTEETENNNLCKQYRAKGEYLKKYIFYDSSRVIYIDNQQEIENFHIFSTETSLRKAQESKNPYLIHSAQNFQEELNLRVERKGAYLNLFEANNVITDLIASGKIKKKHYNFFINNQIGAYYYCGSIANSVVTAYNPYFQDIQFEQISSGIKYRSTCVYDPNFMLNVLLGLKIINTAEDIKNLSSKDINYICEHKSWKLFQEMLSELYNDIFTINEFIKQEERVQKKVERWKKGVFDVTIGLMFGTTTSVVSGMLFEALLAGAVGTLVGLIADNMGIMRNMKKVTVDRIVDNIIASREPFYIIMDRIKQAVNRLVHEK